MRILITRSPVIVAAILPFFVVLLFLAAGCGKKTDQDRVADAQECIDRATAATVSTCVTMVEGLTSKGSYLIRCVSKYVEEGLADPASIYSAIAASQTSGAGAAASGSMAMMSVLAFKGGGDAAKGLANATAASTYCTASGSKGLIMLSTLTVTATVATSLGSCAATPTAACIKSGLSTIATNPLGQAAIGSAAISAYQSNCSSGQTTTGGMCAQLAAVVGTNTDSSVVGGILGTCYANCPSVVSPCTSCVGFTQ